MNVSNSDPVAPSAWNHVCAGSGTPALPWPPSQSGESPKYIARSATIGTSDSITVANERLIRSATSPA